jgi:hypothetical protein
MAAFESASIKRDFSEGEATERIAKLITPCKSLYCIIM